MKHHVRDEALRRGPLTSKCLPKLFTREELDLRQCKRSVYIIYYHLYTPY